MTAPATVSRDAASSWERSPELAGVQLIRSVPLGDDSLAYSARDTTGRLVFLQKVAPAGEPSVVVRLAAELQQYRALRHANLFEVYDVVKTGQGLVVLTECVDGASLQACLRNQGKYPVASAIRIVLAVAKGVESLHQIGIVHRAIRPSTIRLTTHGRAKLELPRFPALSAHEGAWLATPAGLCAAQYIAPEQVQQPKDNHPRADVYALAATLYHLITGQAPASPWGMVDNPENLNMLPRNDPTVLVPDLDRDIADLIRCSLSPDPAHRPASVAAFIDRLQGKLEKIGKYKLLEQVGQTRSATLYRAQAPDGRVVAVKVLRAEAAAEDRRLMRFYQEAKLAMQVDHPRVVHVLEVGVDGGQHFLAMDYVEGENLARWTMRRGRLDEPTALRIVGQLADAIARLHTLGIIHRDVNPANILIDRGENAVLGDLGLSKQSGFDLNLTAVGTGLGTAVFAAPEQLTDAKHVDSSCDVYGLGATLCSMVTGKRPFAEEELLQLLLAKRSGRCISAREVSPALTKETDWLIRKAMRPLAAQRPTMAEFAKYVRACLRSCRPATQPVAASWHILCPTADGQKCRATATAEQIGRLIQTGRLGPDTPTAPQPEGPYAPLGQLAAFQHLFGPQANDRRPMPAARPTPLLSRIFARLKRFGQPSASTGSRAAEVLTSMSRVQAKVPNGRRYRYAAVVTVVATCILALFLLTI